jgi:hypothetical protein
MLHQHQRFIYGNLLYHLRFFLRDIAQELQDMQCKSSFRVYRGQYISFNEINPLRTGGSKTTHLLFNKEKSH